MSDQINEVNESNFEHVVLHSKKPVLVDFWAAWCGPCLALAPTVNRIAEQYANSTRIVKLNVDRSPSIARRYGIQGIPNLILFRDGEEKERIVGVTSEEQISRIIDEHVTVSS